MFLFSKLVWIFGQPLSLAFFLTLFAFLVIVFGYRKLGALFSALAALLLFLILFTTAGNYLLQGLETRFPKPDRDPDSLQCMIVLGGAFENEVNTAKHGIEFNAAADRFVETLRLAQKYPQSRILISGGDGSMSGGYEGDAAASARFFPALWNSTRAACRRDDIPHDFRKRAKYQETACKPGIVELPADHIRVSHAAFGRHFPQAGHRCRAMADGLPDRRQGDARASISRSRA